MKEKMRAFKSYSFLWLKKQWRVRQALLKVFFKPQDEFAADASTSYFKINVPLFCYPLFFKNHFNSQVRINKMVNKQCLLPSQYFTINLKDTPCSVQRGIFLSQLKLKFCSKTSEQRTPTGLKKIVRYWEVSDTVG